MMTWSVPKAAVRSGFVGTGATRFISVVREAEGHLKIG